MYNDVSGRFSSLYLSYQSKFQVDDVADMTRIIEWNKIFFKTEASFSFVQTLQVNIIPGLFTAAPTDSY